MKKLLLPALLVAAGLTFFSCQKTEVKPGMSQEQSGTTQQTSRYVIFQNSDEGGIISGRIEDCIPTEVLLIAGQTMTAGTITVSNDADFIYVTYTTTNGWVLTQTHLYVGDCALIPVNNPGNPIPGQFPYKAVHNNITSYTYTVPISQIPAGGCGCIAAHSVVKQLNGSGGTIQTQTGWGQGTLINLTGGNWGMKFDYCSCVPE